MIELLKILACLLAGISFGRWIVYSEKTACKKGYNDAKQDMLRPGESTKDLNIPPLFPKDRNTKNMSNV